MNKVYTDDEIHHAIQVGGNGYYLKGMLEQVYNNNKMLLRIIAMDSEGCEALVKSHLKLEDELAELNELLDLRTS